MFFQANYYFYIKIFINKNIKITKNIYKKNSTNGVILERCLV